MKTRTEEENKEKTEFLFDSLEKTQKKATCATRERN